MWAVPFDVDDSLKELTRHGEEEFPVAVYRRRLEGREEGWLILHWHEEIQFVLPVTGPILFTVGGTSYTLTPPEPLFINSHALHKARPLDSGGGEYICIDIHPRLLYGYDSALVSRRYVQPFLAALPALLLDGAAPWHRQARSLLEEIVRVYSGAEYAYEMEIQKLVLEVWLLLIRNSRDRAAIVPPVRPGEQERLDAMLAYIKDHCAETVALAGIAAAGHLSPGACCRLLKRATGLSPIAYLNHLRVAKSAALLQSSDASITEIAQAVGFGTSSYYTARFKQIMNCTPLVYRRRFRSGT